MDDIIIEALGGSANQVNELWQALDLMQDERDSISWAAPIIANRCS
jgi:hypothetical protein